MAEHRSIPESAHLHHEAARCYSEKAQAYVRWSARYVVQRAVRCGQAPTPGRPAAQQESGESR